MRCTATLIAATCLLAAAAVGCSKSADDTAKDCAAALTKRTGGHAGDRPTVSEAKKRVDAADDALAGMVRSGYADVAEEAFDALDSKTKHGGKNRPEACKSLPEKDYTVLLAAKSFDGLGWTDKNGHFDKLKMVESLNG